MSDDQNSVPENPAKSVPAMPKFRDEGRSSAVPEVRAGQADSNDLTCPVCGAAVVQEKCKMICRSDTCRGRVVMNCSEF
jgi:hypothetical protein